MKVASIALACLALGPPLRADDDAGNSAWARVYASTAEAIGMSFADDEGGPLELVEKPLLRYANPVRGVEQHGTIHLWTSPDSRPAVVASVWSLIDPRIEGNRRLNLEWHSLAARPVAAEYGGERLWRSPRPGVEWRALGELPPPNSSERLRLLQMRRIASGFSAEIERGESELRMLSQPLHRWTIDGEVLDGAMFAFVMGTDPEFFVLVEARPAEDGDDPPGWHVGIVRFTNSALVVRRDGRDWWSCERFVARPRNEPYFLKGRIESLPADLAGTRFDVPSSDREETP